MFIENIEEYNSIQKEISELLEKLEVAFKKMNDFKPIINLPSFEKEDVQ
jgi:hypothetical protein